MGISEMGIFLSNLKDVNIFKKVPNEAATHLGNRYYFIFLRSNKAGNQQEIIEEK